MSEGSEQLQTIPRLRVGLPGTTTKQTMTRFLYTTGIALLWLCSPTQAAPPEARLPEKHRAFFKAHCLDCHDSETREGKVDLETLSFQITTLEQA